LVEWLAFARLPGIPIDKMPCSMVRCKPLPGVDFLRGARGSHAQSAFSDEELGYGREDGAFQLAVTVGELIAHSRRHIVVDEGQV
jgi:hypothetical protein